MKDEQKNKVSWSELRRKYQDIPFEIFGDFVKKVSLPNLDEEEMQILHLLLQEENEKSRAAEAATKKLLRDKLETITASMMHCELKIDVPEWLDKDHVQAYIVYGLLMPSSPRTFAGSRDISRRTVKDFVRHKLGRVFNSAKYDCAENWLINHGVVDSSRGRTLNTKENRSGVTREGRLIIIEAKRMLHKYRPTRRQ